MKAIPVRAVVLLVAALLLSVPGAGEARAQEVTLNVGDKAPSFQAVDADGKPWKSEDYVGEKVLVVYFYPAAMTGGCTKQACGFRDHRSQLTDLGAEVIGVSGDPVSNLQVFRKAHRLNFPLLSDESGEIARKFGVPVGEGGTFKTSVDGKEVALDRNVTTARWTFIIDRDGNIVYKNTEANPERDSEEVIAAIEQLEEE